MNYANMQIRAYDPPRWRRRRAADLRVIASVYGTALLFCLALLAIASFDTNRFFVDAGMARYLRPIFLAVVYLFSGSLVIALAVHRMALWRGAPSQPMPTFSWASVVFWPIYVGHFLFRLVTSRWS